MEDMKISPVGQVILRRTFSEVNSLVHFLRARLMPGVAEVYQLLRGIQFREYLVIKLSDVKSDSHMLNPGI
jgi:hypothetical protein